MGCVLFVVVCCGVLLIVVVFVLVFGVWCSLFVVRWLLLLGICY